MQSKYIKGYACAQDPEGMEGHLYKIIREEDEPKWLFVDEIEPGRFQYWYFNHQKRLIDGGEFETSDTDTDLILDEARKCASITDDAVLELEDTDLCIGDLEGEFTGM